MTNIDELRIHKIILKALKNNGKLSITALSDICGQDITEEIGQLCFHGMIFNYNFDESYELVPKIKLLISLCEVG